MLPLNQICGGTLRALQAMMDDASGAADMAAAADAAAAASSADFGASPTAEAGPAKPRPPSSVGMPQTPLVVAMPLRSCRAGAGDNGGGAAAAGGWAAWDGRGPAAALAVEVPAAHCEGQPDGSAGFA